MGTIRCISEEDCTGCAACANLCPTHCISMQADAEGFLHPVVEESSCISCSLCLERCPVGQTAAAESASCDNAGECYAAWARDPEIREQSTSGGIFSCLAKEILKDGGCVIGARYREDQLVEHAGVDCEEELFALRQSKYIQSEIGQSYQLARERLAHGKKVLFAGTPCQCAGLRAFLEKEYPQLYLCDFICRGVNSPVAYQAYLKELEEQYQSKVRRVWFKNKTYGWNRFSTKIEFADGQEYLSDRETDAFMLGFIKSGRTLYLRPSCYECRFKGTARQTDITLGDFWGVSLENKADADGGVSAVITHTEKGRTLLERIAPELVVQKRSIREVEKGNPCLLKSVEKNETARREFWNRIHKEPFREIIMTIKEDKQ